MTGGGEVPSARNIPAATSTLLQVIGFLQWICCMLGWHVCEGGPSYMIGTDESSRPPLAEA